MTTKKAKQKAIDLIEKFEDKVNPYKGSGRYYSAILRQSKKCAHIVCDEAQELLNKPMFQYKQSLIWKAEFEFWQDVKHEIDSYSEDEE